MLTGATVVIPGHAPALQKLPLVPVGARSDYSSDGFHFPVDSPGFFRDAQAT